MPISATVTAPQSSRPGSSRWPGFLRKKVTVRSARKTTSPSTAPLSPESPLGTSTATTGRARARTASAARRAAPSSGRVRPAPNRASITSGVPSSREPTWSASSARPSTAPFQRAACAAASPCKPSREPMRASRTAAPASDKTRAATKPSPPLLPGPQSTRTGRPGQPSRAAAATAAPAFSMRATPDTPAAMAAASARYISSTESRTFCAESVMVATALDCRGDRRRRPLYSTAVPRNRLPCGAAVAMLTSEGARLRGVAAR